MGSHFTKRTNTLVNAEHKKSEPSAVAAAYQASVNNLLNSEQSKNSLWQNTQINAHKKSNELATSELYNAAMEKAMWPLSGEAARQYTAIDTPGHPGRSGLLGTDRWYSIGTLTENELSKGRNQGALNAFGSNYADQEFMSYDYTQNHTGKNINVNLQTRAAAESSNLIDQFTHPDLPGYRDEVTRHEVITNTGLEAEKTFSRIEQSLNYPYMFNGVTIENDIDREAEQVDPDNLWLDTTKANIIADEAINTALDQGDANYYKNLNFFEKIDYHAEAGYDLFKKKVVIPAADAVVGAFNDLAYNNTETTADDSLLGKGVTLISGHLEESYRAAAYHANEIKDEIVEIGGELKDHVYLYGHAIQSIKHGLVEGEFLPPTHFQNVRKAEEHQERLELEKAEKHRKNVIQAHKEYGESRQEQLDDVKALNQQDAARRALEFQEAGSAEAYYEKKRMERVVEAHKVYGESRELQRKAEEKRRAEVIASQKVAAKLAEERANAPKGTVYPGDPNNKVKDAVDFEKQKAIAHMSEGNPLNVGSGRGDIYEKPGERESYLRQKLAENLRNTIGGPVGMQTSEQGFGLHDFTPGKGGRSSRGSFEKKANYFREGTKEFAGGELTALEKKLGKDPFKFSSFAYPRDVTQDMSNGHYMLFYVNVQNKSKYEYAGTKTRRGWRSRVGDVVESSYVRSQTEEAPAKTIYTYARGADAGDISYHARQVGYGGKGNIISTDSVDLRKGRKPSTGLGSYLPTTTRISDSVAIYLPPNVEDTTVAGYDDFKTGVAGLVGAGGVQFIQAMKRQDYDAAAELFVGAGKGIAMEALRKFGFGAVEALTNAEGVEQTFNKAFGQSLNPYMEVAFNNMHLRDFSYSFTFRPKNQTETEDVKAIIQLFRFHMAPELKGNVHRYLTLPSTFDIHYMYQSNPDTATENSFYSKIATCVLNNCSVDYTPDGVKSFHDGAPTQIKMTLSFKETEMLTKEKINEGY